MALKDQEKTGAIADSDEANTARSNASDQLLREYYQLYVDTEVLFNQVNSESDLLKLIRSDEDESEETSTPHSTGSIPPPPSRAALNKLVDRFCRLLGVVDFYFAIADEAENSVHLFKNRKLDNRHLDVPILLLDENQGFETNRLSKDNQLVFDLMIEAEENFIRLDVKKDYKSPYFLKNLPPFRAREGAPESFGEKTLRKENKINFLYCPMGEVSYFLYFYTYLIDMARYRGFDALFNPAEIIFEPTPHLRGPDPADDSDHFWTLDNWRKGGFSDIPEMQFLKVIEQVEGYETYRQEDLDKIGQTWKKYREQKKPKIDKARNFLNTHKLKLGLETAVSEPNSPETKQAVQKVKRNRQSVLSYAAHVLISMPIPLVLSVREMFPWANQKDGKEGFDLIYDWLDERTKINNLGIPEPGKNGKQPSVEEIEQHKEANRAEIETKFAELESVIYKKITQDESGNDECDRFLHHFVLLSGFMLFSVGLKYQDYTVGNLIRQIHRRARFPLFQGYFHANCVQESLSVPVEYYCFPIQKSLRFRVKTKIIRAEASRESNLRHAHLRRSTPHVAVSCVLLTPIWEIELQNKPDKLNGLRASACRITQPINEYEKVAAAELFKRGEERYFYEKYSGLSNEALMRLNLIQDYIKFLGQFLVDDFFYGKVIKQKTVNEAKDEQYMFQSHEIRNMITKIDPDTPAHILKYVREYFDIIFGAREEIVRALADHLKNPGGEETWVSRMAAVNTLEEMCRVACQQAAEIYRITQSVTKFGTGGQMRFVSGNTLMTEISAIKSSFEISIKAGENQAIPPQWFTMETKAVGLYLFMALVAGLTNAIKHSPNISGKHNPVEIYLQPARLPGTTSTLVIKNTPPRNYSPGDQHKYNMGSTAISLRYYINAYLGSTSRPKVVENDLFFVDEAGAWYTYIPVI